MERKYCVYCHTSPDGKRYFGVTSRKPERRWSCGNGYIDNPYFYNSIKKYGWNSFRHDIIYSNLTWYEASYYEKLLISRFETTNRSKGYNLDSGGLFGDKTLSEETKRKIGDAHRGKYTEAQWAATKARGGIGHPHTEEAKKKIGDSHRGKPLSEEHKQKLSESHKGIKPSAEKVEKLRQCHIKSVEKYTLDGKLVATYESITLAAQSENASPCSVGKCCRGKRKQVKGYIWKFPSQNCQF